MTLPSRFSHVERPPVLQLDPPGRRQCIPSFWEKLMIQIFNLKLIIQWPTFKRWGFCTIDGRNGIFLKTWWPDGFVHGKYVGGNDQAKRMGKGDGKTQKLLSASILRGFSWMYRKWWMQPGMNLHDRMVHAKSEKDLTTSLSLSLKCLCWFCCHAFSFDKLYRILFKISERCSDFSMQQVNLKDFSRIKIRLDSSLGSRLTFPWGWAVSSIHHPQAVPPSRGGLEMMWNKWTTLWWNRWAMEHTGIWAGLRVDP